MGGAGDGAVGAGSVWGEVAVHDGAAAAAAASQSQPIAS